MRADPQQQPEYIRPCPADWAALLDRREGLYPRLEIILRYWWECVDSTTFEHVRGYLRCAECV
jgi:hypothetical protein